MDEPQFSGWRRFLKYGIDRAGAVVGPVLLSPALLGAALAVRLTSPGPALLRQGRTGVGGQEFRVVKFRTMFRDADARLAGLAGENEGDGLLFKIKDDPRITRVGAFLRRTSIDALPQLLNVLPGRCRWWGRGRCWWRMTRAVTLDGDVRRRMLVRPEITGLWQVSGRSDMRWEDAVRLDLYYVETGDHPGPDDPGAHGVHVVWGWGVLTGSRRAPAPYSPGFPPASRGPAGAHSTS